MISTAECKKTAQTAIDVGALIEHIDALDTEISSTVADLDVAEPAELARLEFSGQMARLNAYARMLEDSVDALIDATRGQLLEDDSTLDNIARAAYD